MSVPDLPFVGQKNWGSPLNAGIEARTNSDYLADKLAEDGPFRSSLMSTYVAPTGAGGRLQVGGTDVTPAQAVGDTGRRNVTPGTGVTAGALVIRRFGPIVTVHFDGLTLAEAGGSFTQIVSAVPAGFRPPTFIDHRTAPRNSLEYRDTLRLASNGTVVLYNYAAGQAVRALLTYDTTNTFPALPYPGAPA